MLKSLNLVDLYIYLYIHIYCGPLYILVDLFGAVCCFRFNYVLFNDRCNGSFWTIWTSACKHGSANCLTYCMNLSHVVPYNDCLLLKCLHLDCMFVYNHYVMFFTDTSIYSPRIVLIEYRIVLIEYRIVLIEYRIRIRLFEYEPVY